MYRFQTVSRNRSQAGFNLVELAIVVMTIALLSIIALPNFIKAREATWQSVCTQQLNKMDAAKILAAFEKRWPDGAGPATIGNPYYKDTVSQYLQSGDRPFCPSGYAQYYNAIGEDPTCTSGFTGHEFMYSKPDP